MFHGTVKHAVLRAAIAIAVFSVFMTSGAACAHDFWVNASGPKDGIVRAEIGYGHDFPKPEPIPADRTKIFEGLQLATPNGMTPLAQIGENYAYEGKAELKKGSFLVLGTYRPTFWSNGPDGWAQKDRTQRADATYCEEVTMFAKTILDIEGSREADFISKPAGQRLEIVPLVHPATVRPGEKFPVRILFEGKPMKTAKLEATFAGFSNKEYKAFVGRTDLDGVVEIIPLKAGYWFAEAEYSFAHPQKDKADKVLLLTTLSFRIGE
jgi:uncharacterized GH25 family protein